MNQDLQHTTLQLQVTNSVDSGEIGQQQINFYYVADIREQSNSISADW